MTKHFKISLWVLIVAATGVWIFATTGFYIITSEPKKTHIVLEYASVSGCEYVSFNQNLTAREIRNIRPRNHEIMELYYKCQREKKEARDQKKQWRREWCDMQKSPTYDEFIECKESGL